jgi:hypothetical protein
MRRLLRGGPWVRGAIWLAHRAWAAWSALDASERRRFGELLLKSRGRPGKLTITERAQMRRIATKARSRAFGRRLLRRG